MSEHNRQCGNEPDANSELQHKQLGYALAWESPNGGRLNISPSSPYTLEEARVLLAARRIEKPHFTHMILEVSVAEGGAQ